MNSQVRIGETSPQLRDFENGPLAELETSLPTKLQKTKNGRADRIGSETSHSLLKLRGSSVGLVA